MGVIRCPSGKRLVSSGALTVILGLAGCLAPDKAGQADGAGAGLLPGVRHVLVVGFDGLGAYAWEKAEMPRLKALAAQGALSLKVRSVLPSSSAVNWATHLMGAGPELHGYTEWDSKESLPPARAVGEYGRFPGIFGLVRNAYPRAEIGALYQWDGIRHVIENQAVSFEKNDKNFEELTDSAVDYILTKRPQFTFVCYDEPDGVGHREGHDTPQYYAMLKRCDEELGELLDALRTAGMEKDTLVLVIADHGGIEKGHGGKTLAEMETPGVICGPGVKKGHAIESSVVHYDTAATLAHVFGAPPPQVWTGRPVREAFAP